MSTNFLQQFNNSYIGNFSYKIDVHALQKECYNAHRLFKLAIILLKKKCFVPAEVSDEAEVIVINVATLVILPESVGTMAVTIVTVVVEEAFMSVIVPTADPLNVGQLVCTHIFLF